jgi:NADH-quinone oxidoreductase subunit E
MLGESARLEIEKAIDEYPNPQGAAIDALRIVQRHHRWVSDEHLAETAEMLGMSVEQLDGIATFYNRIYRRPVGRHVIEICDSVVCWMLEQPRLVAELERRGLTLGETSGDGRVTLLPTPCLGACHRAPALLVDGELHDGLTVERVARLLEELP